MKTYTLFLLLILSLSAQAQRFHNQKIIGFVQGDRNVTLVDYKNLTHAVFAFAVPNANGTIKSMPAAVKPNFALFLEATKKAGTSRIIAIAPVSAGSKIKEIAKNPVALHKFADTLVKFCKKYEFAGVDMDWELLNSSADSIAYNRLIDTLDVQLHKAGLILTADVAFTNYYGQWMPTKALHKLDWIQVMAYDGTGWGSGPFGNHSSMQHMINGAYYWKARGFSKDKLVLGVPFYGHTFSNTASESVATVSYNNIIGLFPSLPDSANQTPGIDYTFFNGPALIRQKCQYLIDSSFAGVMIWDMTQDATGEKSLHKQIVCTYNDGNCIPVKPYCNTDINAGVKGLWSFSGNADDNSGNNNTGMVKGAKLTTDRFNNPNGAYLFEGNAQIDCDKNPSLNVDDFTMSAWVNTSQDPSDFQTIFAKYDYDSTASYVFYLNWNHLGIGIHEAETRNALYFHSPASLIPDKWYHVSVTHSYINGTKLYINGMLDAHDTTHIHVLQAPEDHFKIGWSPVLKQFEGKIDDIRIHNIELSPCGIDSLFHSYPSFANAVAAPECKPDIESGLIANWPFDGNAQDAGNPLHHGTVNGAQTAPDRFGNTNNAYSFSEKSYIDCGTDTTLNVKDFSISAWVKTDNYTINSTVQTIAAKLRQSTDTVISYAINLYDFYPSLFINGGSGNQIMVQANAFLTPDRWYHITATHSYENGSKMYINGSLQKHNETKIDPLKVANAHFKIGRSDFAPDQFNGRIDDIRIYNKEINECTVESLYRLPYEDRITDLSDEQLLTQGIKVYPNPNKGNFTVALPAKPTAATGVSISDITGKIIAAYSLTEINTPITLAQPIGIYFVHILTEKSSYVIKIIIND